MPKIDNKPSEEQLRKWFFEERKSTNEVAELVGVARQTVWIWKKQVKIPVGFIQPFTKTDIEYRYYVLGETQSEIGVFFGVDQGVISHWMGKWGLSTIPGDERNDMVNPVILSELQEDIVRGTMFGDASLRVYNGFGSGKNSLFITDHGDRQRNYAIHLEEALRPYTARPVFRYWRDDPRCKNGGSWINNFRTNSHRFWTRLRDVWYPYGEKIVPEQELWSLNSRSLAYLYADDGTRCGMACNIYTLSFSREDNHRISDFLKDGFQVSTEVKKFSGTDQFYIHFDRVNTRAFMDLIEPFLKDIPDMGSKFVPKVRAKAF